MHWKLDSVASIEEGWRRYAGSFLPIPGDWRPHDWLHEERRSADPELRARLDEAAHRLATEAETAVGIEARAYLALLAPTPVVLAPPSRAASDQVLCTSTHADRVARLARLRTDDGPDGDAEILALGDEHVDLGLAVVGAIVPRFGWIPHDRPPSVLATLGERLLATLPSVRDEALSELRSYVTNARDRTARDLGLDADNRPERWTRYAEDCALAALGRAQPDGPSLAIGAPSPRVLQALREAVARDAEPSGRALAELTSALASVEHALGLADE